MEINFTPKTPQKFCCKKCNFTTSKNSDYQRHLLTAKHRKEILEIIGNEFYADSYVCSHCKKKYKTSSGLWKHQSKCLSANSKKQEIADQKSDDNDLKDLVVKLMIDNNEKMNMLMQENNDLKSRLCEQSKNISELLPKIGNIHNYNNSNNVKQRFNINVFLNEQCKNAISLDDFINSIKVSIQQLDYTHNNGLENGLTNIIMENMKNLSMYERPLHCTDLKRETLYIKKHANWTKDDNNESLKKAINNVSTKQYKALNNWVKENPDYLNDESKQYYYAKTLSTIGKPLCSLDNKIIKNICNKNHINNKLITN